MSETASGLCSADVAGWLREHPDFLAGHPDLVQHLIVPREDGPAASLVGYQLEILRNRNQALERRLQDLSTNAQLNEQLATRIHQLCLALMACRTQADTLRTLAASLAEDFAGEQVAIVLFQPPLEPIDAPWLQVIASDAPALSPLAELIAAGTPSCGRLSAERNAVLYRDAAATVSSSAVVPLAGVGLLAVGSRDPHRFWPGMGTVFLEMMAQSLLAALSRHS